MWLRIQGVAVNGAIERFFVIGLTDWGYIKPGWYGFDFYFDALC